MDDTKFKNWERSYYDYICFAKRKTKHFLSRVIMTHEALSLYAPFFHMFPIWDYHMDILTNGSDELRFELYLDCEKNK